MKLRAVFWKSFWTVLVLMIAYGIVLAITVDKLSETQTAVLGFMGLGAAVLLLVSIISSIWRI